MGTSHLTNPLAQLLGKVTRGNAEVSLVELFKILGLPENESTLAKVVRVAEEIRRMGLQIVPNISQGELDSTRRIVFAEEGAVTADTIRSELENRETETLELKSSLLYDHKKAALQPDAPRFSLKSEEVLHASLKTIAGFLTTSGGNLFVGVDDSGKLLGIDYDFCCMTDKPERQNADGWELTLRGYIRGRFKDGDTVNNYIGCNILELDQRFIARVNVSPRRQLSFLKQKDVFALYRRQGNQTIQVAIDQIEEFLEIRRSSFD